MNKEETVSILFSNIFWDFFSLFFSIYFKKNLGPFFKNSVKYMFFFSFLGKKIATFVEFQKLKEKT